MLRNTQRGTVTESASGSGLVRAVQQRARADYFVGRQPELAGFTNLLEARNTPAFVFVHGPGGIGKSSMLDRFEQIAEHAKCQFVRVDARQLQRAPESITSALREALERLPCDGSAPRVLALDHAEHLAALDDWLRSEWLPNLPGDLVLVLASRQEPSARWRADPGIRALLIEYALEPLGIDMASQYLKQRGINGDQANAVQEFAFGYPLLLALAADQVLREPHKPFDIRQLPDLIGSLVEWLLNEVEQPIQLQALQACATMRRLDQPMLAAMLDRKDATPEFDWLSRQHYVERQPQGLVIHDLVRGLVIDDLRGRDLALHHTVIRRAFGYLMAGADISATQFRVKSVPQMLFALREEAHVRKNFNFESIRCYPDAVSANEISDLAAEVERLEGSASRSWFEYWATDPTAEIELIREPGRQPVAFALMLRLRSQEMRHELADPCVRALWRHLQKHAPFRDDEQVLLTRFRMAYGSHQKRTSAWTELSAQLHGRIFTPGISMHASVADISYDWSGMAENAEIHLLSDSEYRVGERVYMISAHDMRQEPVLTWAYKSLERVLSAGTTPELEPAEVMLLQKPEFSQAVRHALRHYCDEEGLANSPLLYAPMLRRYANHCDTDALRKLIDQTSAGLAEGIQTLLDKVFFRPIAAKQKAIAYDLHVSERTLRRRVGQAEERLIEVLWQRDTHP